MSRTINQETGAVRQPANSDPCPLTPDPCFQIPRNATRLAGFRAWAHSSRFPERGHVSFFNGELFVDMSPEELETHNKVKEAIVRCLGNLNEEHDWGELFADGVLVTHFGANLSTEPDGTFILWQSLKAGRVQYIARKNRSGEFIEIRGSPDWLLEVVSAFSVTKDTSVLPALYHQAGIPEFWLVDARGAEISFQILLHRTKKYRMVDPSRGWSYSPVFQRSFRLTRKRNRMGRWRYQLESRKA
jgi:Uma2 family endonuclease